MEKIQSTLQQIREKEHDRKQQLLFNQWQLDHEDHIQALYKITSGYYFVIYDDFVRALYRTMV